MFQRYDAERGEGAQAAARYEIANYPTLLVVDEKGAVLVRQVGLETAKVSSWLTTQAMALRPETELEAQVKAHPDDVDALSLLARRAEARGDLVAMRGWLARIESGDASQDRAAAAEAGWRRMESELDEKLRREVRAATLDYLKRYPAHGANAVKALAAAGADGKTVETELARVVEASGKDDDLNGLVYLGLSLGAYDAARLAAEKQLQLNPDDPNAHDSLAEVWNYRGDRARAMEIERKGMEKKDVSPELAAAMRANLKRFETGGLTSDVRPRPVLPSPLAPGAGSGAPQATPEFAARRLYSKNADKIAAQCAPRAKGMDEAWVRVRVGEGKLEEVQILEPSATPALRKCLARAVRAVAVPAEQRPARVTMAIPL